MLRGWQLYARMLRCLAEAPATSRAIADHLGIGKAIVCRYARRLHDLGVIGRCGWDDSVRGPTAAIWSADPSDRARRAPYKNGAAPRRNWAIEKRLRSGVELISFVALIRALAEPSSLYSLVDASGANYGSVSRFLRFARGIDLVHIAEWEVRLSGAPVALWAIDVKKPDRARPAPMPRVLVEKRYRHARAAKRQALQITHALASNASAFIWSSAA